jgi:AcrR family transcriptional regulator
MRGAGRGLDHRPTAQRVVAAAAKLFYEKGYSETSMQDVADEVGVLKGSLPARSRPGAGKSHAGSQAR